MTAAILPFIASVILAAQVQDTTSVLAIRYENLLLAVFGDDTNGLTVFAAGVRGSGVRSFDAQFDPGLIGPWSQEVQDLSDSAASRPLEQVASSTVSDLHGGGLFVLFEAGRAGASRAVLVYQPDPDSTMRPVAMSAGDVEALAGDLQRLSLGARWVPPDYERDPARPRTHREVDTQPERVAGPRVNYSETPAASEPDRRRVAFDCHSERRHGRPRQCDPSLRG